MKLIPKDDLIKMIKYSHIDDLSLEDVTELFELFGDDWYVIDGDLQCTKEKNRERKIYIRKLKSLG